MGLAFLVSAFSCSWSVTHSYPRREEYMPARIREKIFVSQANVVMWNYKNKKKMLTFSLIFVTHTEADFVCTAHFKGVIFLLIKCNRFYLPE